MTLTRRWLALSFVLGPLFGLVGCSGGGTVATAPAVQKSAAVREDPLESARQVLDKSPDRAACATALQKLNGYFAAQPEKRPPALTAEQRDFLKKHFGLDERTGEPAEVESATFTLLDGPHLEFCYLLRDVARSLDVEKLPPAERAAVAFAWVMRQVVLQEGEGESPPEFVLRRGVGTGLERAYIFLALLRQLDVPGCLLTTPGADAPWGCGALVEGEGDKQKQVLVFDHRLGLPLPGPKGPAGSPLARAFRLATLVPAPDDGQQIATLAALRKQPDLLKPLTTDEKQPYDVGPEQLKDAVVRLALPLSALSPRMRTLQDELLPQKAGVRTAADPAKWVNDFASAAGVEGGAGAVREWGGATGVLRRFLTEREGGIDKQDLQQRARVALVPKGNLPRQLTDLGRSTAGEHLLANFAAPFIMFQLEPGNPRDHLLRGQLTEAVEGIQRLRDQSKVNQGYLQNNPDVLTDFEKWKEALFSAYGQVVKAQEAARRGGPQEAVEQALAQREQVEKQGAKMLSVIVEGLAAEPRLAQATYQLAVCMGEQAERAQARADELSRANPPADAEELAAARDAAKGAWKDAAGWWHTYIQTYPGTPFTFHGQVLRARALMALGDRDGARALLTDDAPGIGAPQKRARQYMAQRLKAP
jgi:hypothetical protein